jgi:hypothetical protein
LSRFYTIRKFKAILTYTDIRVFTPHSLAQTPASFVYDYYNEEAKATVKPMRFVVK